MKKGEMGAPLANGERGQIKHIAVELGWGRKLEQSYLGAGF